MNTLNTTLCKCLNGCLHFELSLKALSITNPCVLYIAALLIGSPEISSCFNVDEIQMENGNLYAWNYKQL